MKGFRVIIALALALGATPILPTLPAAASPESITICREDILPSDPNANLGECVSFGKSFGTDAFAAHLCDYLRESDPDFEENYGSYADCVQLIREEL